MKAEITFPPELVDEIVERLFEKIKPLLTISDNRADDLLDLEGFVKYTGLKESWVYQKHSDGTLPFPVIKTGKYLKFRRSEVDKWLRKSAIERNPKPVSKKSDNGVRRLLDQSHAKP